MKNCLFLLLVCILFSSCNAETIVKSGQWTLELQEKGVTIRKDSVSVFREVYPSYSYEGNLITASDYPQKKVKKSGLKDDFGEGILFRVIYSGNNLPVLEHNFYVYDSLDYLLTDFTLAGKSGIGSNYMAPVNTDVGYVLPETGDNRALFVPFDNDCWVRYKSHPLAFDSLISYEVTAIFNNDRRNGIVIGSVEHDFWKTGVKLENASGNRVGSLSCFGGIADSFTRDSKPHGAVSGKSIKSPKVFLGVFDDWRNGMEEFGRANALVAPPKAWGKAMPVGWNSWGVLQFGLTYPKALEVSDFFKNNLQNNHFINADGTVVIGLDSGWNSFSEEQLKSFVEKCKENGQIAGVYWTPFTDWGRNPEQKVHDAEDYFYKDIYVYANGKPQELDGAYAIDPTHPAVEQRMKKTADLFRRCGFEYVKMDFMTHGAMEGDTWYLPEIQTGMQAYNYGLQLLDNYFGDMYINLSISPIFPAQYAQSRRIACDAWNKIKDTEYTMNAVSYGWWIDRIYQYNDADHIVLRDATEGENRARITSSVVTGLYMAGDDYSEEGTEEGKQRSLKYLTNPAVNKIADGVSFRPVEGNGEESECRFVKESGDGLYYAVFNYSDQECRSVIPLERLGLDPAGDYPAEDLWSGETFTVTDDFTIPGKDVKLFRIRK